MRAGLIRVGVVSAVVLLGCAQDQGLVPAPQAKIVPGTKELAYQVANGVLVQAHGDAWQGHPADLDDVMTPVRVTIRNRSDKPVRVMYRDFALRTPDGFHVRAIPPFQINVAGPTRSSVIRDPAFYYDDFFVSPYYRRHYPRMLVWPYAFPYDGGFYDQSIIWRVPLPTKDMLRTALPEGVIAPGGSVSGFLFFPDVGHRRGTVVFEANLAEGRDGTDVASVDIPFVTK